MNAGESIYNLIPQPVPPVIKPDRYLSKHDGKKPPTFSTFGLTGTSKPGYKNIQGAEAAVAEGHHIFKKEHATMGKEGNARKPSEMLKKGTGGGAGAADANAAGSTGVQCTAVARATRARQGDGWRACRRRAPAASGEGRRQAGGEAAAFRIAGIGCFFSAAPGGHA